MVDYQLQVYKPYENGDWKGKYRFAVIDPNRDGYPANFVCMLPEKIYDKGKPLSIFARKFGDNSLDYAVKLLKKAIRDEQDRQTRVELEKRLKNLEKIRAAQPKCR